MHHYQRGGKLAQELWGEIPHIGECSDALETKFDKLVQYVHVLEEDNASSQQEDLENRERCQNLRIRGFPESVGD